MSGRFEWLEATCYRPESFIKQLLTTLSRVEKDRERERGKNRKTAIKKSGNFVSPFSFIFFEKWKEEIKNRSRGNNNNAAVALL